MNDRERMELLAKGRRLFEACGSEEDYACVAGYLEHNLKQGGWRAEVAQNFFVWLREQSVQPGESGARAAAILKLFEL